MTKTIYKVYIQNRVSITYATTTRNCEDMIKQILDMHYMDGRYMKIIMICNGETKTIFTTNYKDIKRWNLENPH